MITTTATPIKCTTLIPMVVSLWKTRKRIFSHPHKKGVRRPSTTGQTSIAREGARQAEVVAEIYSYSSLCTACTMTVIPITAQKIVRYSSNPRQRWSKTPTSLHNNHHPEK
jgi:hypothetical protein